MAMHNRLKKFTFDSDDVGARRDTELDELLHPAQAFAHPADVVADPDLTLNEKRAILASWASDACAVESAPALRRPPDGGAPMGFDEVIDALRALDKQAGGAADSERYRRVVRRRRILRHGRDGDDRGSPLH
jgi:hypothetical protein